MIAEQLNKERRVLEGLLLQGDIGDSPTTKDAISIITNEGKKLGLAYDKTDQMGRIARQRCAKYDHEIGKIVGKATIEGATPEITQKYVRSKHQRNYCSVRAEKSPPCCSCTSR